MKSKEAKADPKKPKKVTPPPEVEQQAETKPPEPTTPADALQQVRRRANAGDRSRLLGHRLFRRRPEPAAGCACRGPGCRMDRRLPTAGTCGRLSPVARSAKTVTPRSIHSAILPNSRRTRSDAGWTGFITMASRPRRLAVIPNLLHYGLVLGVAVGVTTDLAYSAEATSYQAVSAKTGANNAKSSSRRGPQPSLYTVVVAGCSSSTRPTHQPLSP